MSTVAAIATPNAVGGISVIRISGENAIAVAAEIFRGKNPLEMEGYTCAYGHIHDNGELLDDVVLTVFKAPKSYTGENVVEISCHGGIFITRQILRLILKNGAELAPAGEFTKRAFLNGKLSLTQAEAVMDIISADSSNELKYAVSLREGACFRRIKSISDKIVHVLGNLSVWADYPDEDIPEVEPDALKSSINQIYSELMETSATYDYGRIVRNGINTAIVGKPNVGKSTLMNCLSGFKRSIVTDIAGTTRDVIEESVRLGSLTLRLSDTAGIRTTDDEIEKIGVDIAYSRLDEADLVLAVFDCTIPLCDDDFSLIEKLKTKKAVAVINKSDAESVIDMDLIKQNFRYFVEISAKDNIGINYLSECLEKMFMNNDIPAHQGIIANERQKICVEKALTAVKSAIDALEYGEMLDAVTVLMDEALNALLELTGERVTETVVNDVFSRFCVGK
ncbi:MAG: tRNA uridine-5-carboxymethylaminomethyl(34) synthesis GTPase MnmE [Oscillospiraceae bacterium]